SIVFNFLSAVVIENLKSRVRARRIALAVAIITNLLLLAFFKYLMSVLTWLQGWGLDAMPAGLSIILPLGISFFTFTQIGFLIDVHAGSAKANRFLNYALFVTFFPHLIAGPILHHREIMPQFEWRDTAPAAANLAIGLGIFIVGLSKKVLIADEFSAFVGKSF